MRGELLVTKYELIAHSLLNTSLLSCQFVQNSCNLKLETMRTIILIFTLIIAFLLFFNGCIVNIIGDPAAAAAAEPSVLKLTALALLAVYEVLVRIVPSVGDYSAVSWIIRLLKKISDTLNVTK